MKWILSKAVASIRSDGILRTIVTMVRRVKDSISPAPRDEFDTKRGTETAGHRSLLRLRINSPNKARGVGYNTSSEAHVKVLLGGSIPRTAHFVDLGCGKGRILIIAKEQGFKRVTGVEFARELADVAKANLRACSLDALVIHADAAEYKFPTGPLIVYMYNPFDSEVMRKVAETLKRHPDELWVIYVNPRHDHFSGWMDRVALSEDQLRLYSPDSVSLWHRKRQC